MDLKDYLSIFKMYFGVKKMFEEEKSFFVLSFREEIKNCLNELNDKKIVFNLSEWKKVYEKVFYLFFFKFYNFFKNVYF